MSGKVSMLCVWSVVAVVSLCVAMVTIGAGCQTPGQVVSSKQSTECSACHETLVTSAIKGINFKTYTCPSCHKEYEVDTSGGFIPPKEVLVCPKCGKVYMDCPSCKATHGK